MSAKIKIKSFIWKDDFYAKIGIFCMPMQAHENALDGQLASTLESIRLCMASYQGFYAKSVSICLLNSIVENDDELMLMALHAHFLLQQQYS